MAAKTDGCFLRVTEDTRETKPISFGRYKFALETVRKKLNAGDYACDLIFPINRNKEELVIRSKIIYERKSKNDLWSTFGSTGERLETFKNEVNRSIADGNTLIVIVECEPNDIIKGHFYTKEGVGLVKALVQGPSMMRKLETIRNKYNLCFVYKHGRLNMQRYMYERWLGECREMKRKFKDGLIDREGNPVE